MKERATMCTHEQERERESEGGRESMGGGGRKQEREYVNLTCNLALPSQAGFVSII